MKGSSILWLKHQPWIQQIHIWFLTLPQIFWEALGLSQKPKSIFVWHELHKIFRIGCLCCCSSQWSAGELSKESTSPPQDPWSDSHSGGVRVLRRDLCDSITPDPFRGVKFGEIISTLCLSLPRAQRQWQCLSPLLFWICCIAFRVKAKCGMTSSKA